MVLSTGWEISGRGFTAGSGAATPATLAASNSCACLGSAMVARAVILHNAKPHHQMLSHDLPPYRLLTYEDAKPKQICYTDSGEAGNKSIAIPGIHYM